MPPVNPGKDAEAEEEPLEAFLAPPRAGLGVWGLGVLGFGFLWRFAVWG